MNRTLLIAASVMLSVSTAGYAEDEKTYSGAACQNTTTDPIFDAADMVCPVIRDNTMNVNGLHTALVRVHNDTTGAPARIDCKLGSYRNTGELIVERTAGTELEGNRVLNLKVTQSAKLGFYNLSCHISCLNGYEFCDSRVISYRINEY